MPARPHRTVQRVTRILELVSSARNGHTLTEIASMLDEPKSSIQGFVYGLVDAGYLEEQDRRYFLGPAPLVLSSSSSRYASRYVRHEDLARLAKETGCSIASAYRMGRSVAYNDFVGESAVNEYLIHRQLRRPAIISASGQVLLADLPPDELHDFLSSEPDQDQVSTFLKNLDEINRTGVVYKETSLVEGFSVLATSVRDDSRRPVLAIIAIAEPRFLAEHRSEITESLKRAAAEWSGKGRSAD